MKLVLYCNTILAFGYKTHKYLGNYLDNYLTKSNKLVYSNIQRTLQGNTIENVSIWADTMKKKKGYVWTKKLHYINIMECNKNITNETYYCKDNCIVSGIKDFVVAFKGGFPIGNYVITNGPIDLPKGNSPTKVSIETLTKNELLSFIIHFIQDFNQPMHLIGYDKGGNGFDLIVKQHSGRNKSINVHSLWDKLIPEFYTQHYNFTYKESCKLPPIKTLDDLDKLLLEILNINLKIGCKNYPKDHFIDFDTYFNHIEVETLFNNYVTMSIQIFNYLFNDQLFYFQN